MKITSDIIRGVLDGMFIEGEPIVHQGMSYQLSSIVSRIAVGLNDIISISDQMDSLEEDQIRLDMRHVEETGEIEDEMVRLQEKCPHFSRMEQDSPTAFRLVTCVICGKILEKEITGGS